MDFLFHNFLLYFVLFLEDEGMNQDKLPCFLMITARYLLLGQESESLGFVRTIAVLELSDVTRIFVVRGDLQHTLVLVSFW